MDEIDQRMAPFAEGRETVGRETDRRGKLWWDAARQRPRSVAPDREEERRIRFVESIPPVDRCSRGLSTWRGKPVRWVKHRGYWYMHCRDVAWVLGLPVRVVNQRAKLRRELFPRDFMYLLDRWTADKLSLSEHGRTRKFGQLVPVYSLAGILQLRLLGRDREVGIVRMLAADLSVRASPMPFAMDLPPPPREAEELARWLPSWNEAPKGVPRGKVHGPYLEHLD